ncbi:MAG: hypothetical protein PHY09_17530 [Desulfuromonadaceae bacterium]|nr:hypothetical protein [Desulfuromonadaceae bacterium]MDD5106363.1 hypothetical protein [Desulfuromonadaceae bacterium]
MAFITEADVEMMLLEQLAGLGYSRATDAVIGPDGTAAEREAYSDVILLGRLTAAIDRLNPAIPTEVTWSSNNGHFAKPLFSNDMNPHILWG